MSIEWAAGLFEGEGCIYKDKRKNVWTLQVRMTDRDVVEKFASLMNTGNSIYDESNQPNRIKSGHKPSYRWACSRKQEVKRILLAMLPHFGHRRANKVLDCLDDYEL